MSVFFQSRTMTISRPSARRKPETSIALPNECSDSGAPYDVVDAAAGIGAERLELDDVLAEVGLGVGLDDLGEPAFERDDQRAADRHVLVDRHRPFGQRRNLERVGEAADAGSVDLRLRLDIGGRLHQIAGEAVILRLGAPGRTLRALQPAAAGERNEGAPTTTFGQTLRAIVAE